MSKEYAVPQNLLKPFKILIYKILAYGENEASLDTYVDSDGGNDIGHQMFHSGYNISHKIDADENIDNFLSEICDEISDEYPSDEGLRVEFQIDANTKKMTINIDEFYNDTNETGSSYEYEEILEKFPEFDQLIDSIKNLGGLVEVSYEGGGDSGWIDTSYQGSKKARNFSGDLDKSFEEVLYDFLSNSFGAWGDNEGSKGTIEIDTKNKSIEIMHSEFYQQTRYYGSVRIYDLTKGV